MSQPPQHEPDLLDICGDFLNKYAREDVLELAGEYPTNRSLYIDWMDLFKFDSKLADDLFAHPDTVLSHMEEAVRMTDLPVDVELSGVTVRVHTTDRVVQVDELRAEHMNEYITVAGQVGRTTSVKHFPFEAVFECDRCGVPTRVPQRGMTIKAPHQCDGCEKKGPFTLNPNESEWVDQQILRLREPPERAKGASGAHIDAYLKDDLVGEIEPGDRVKISGIYRLSKDKVEDEQAGVGTRFEARAIYVEQSDFEEVHIDSHIDRIREIAAGRHGDPVELLVESFAPTIHGNETLKEAIILQMFGGVRASVPVGMDYRGDVHILLIGDPGSAKSSLLHAAEEISPRSVFASGKGLTQAGATAAAVRDDFGDEEWSLKAGALVLANKGLACIDEIDKVDPNALSSLHGALESQRVDVAKAGIRASLPARTGVLAAGNPSEGRFDDTIPASEQIDLGPALLSRFDLIFTVTDTPDDERDRVISRHMIEGLQSTVMAHHGGAYTSDFDPPIQPDEFRAYIAHAKRNYFPIIEDEAVVESIQNFYVETRSSYADKIGQEKAPVPITPRTLAAIMRLTQASARVRLSETITAADVKRATHLVQAAMRDTGIDPESGRFDADVIETGQSTTQRSRKMGLRSIIRELSEDGAADVEEVIEVAANELKTDELRIEQDIEQLLHRGEAFKPETGTIRLS